MTFNYELLSKHLEAQSDEIIRLRNALILAELVAGRMLCIINSKEKTGYCQLREDGTENSLYRVDITEDQYKDRHALLDRFFEALKTVK